MNEEIKSGENRIQRFTKNLGSMTSIDTFDTNLEAAKTDVNDIREELQVKEANKHTFKQFIDKMEKSVKSPGDSSCPTCNRSFSNKAESEEVIAALKEEIERVPQKVIKNSKVLRFTIKFALHIRKFWKYFQVKNFKKRLNEALEIQDKMEKLYPEKMACLNIRKEVDEKNKKIESSEECLQNMKSEIKKVIYC